MRRKGNSHNHLGLNVQEEMQADHRLGKDWTTSSRCQLRNNAVGKTEGSLVHFL